MAQMKHFLLVLQWSINRTFINNRLLMAMFMVLLVYKQSPSSSDEC